MTTNELIELSGKVGKAYKILPCWNYSDDAKEITWLHEDSARCFELAVENNLPIEHVYDYATGEYFTVHASDLYEDYDKHNNDKAQATRVAILKALLVLKC